MRQEEEDAPVYLANFREQGPGDFTAELKCPRQLLRTRPGIFDFEPHLGLKLCQTKPILAGTVPANRRTTMLNDSGPMSSCFDDDPKPFKL